MAVEQRQQRAQLTEAQTLATGTSCHCVLWESQQASHCHAKLPSTHPVPTVGCLDRPAPLAGLAAQSCRWAAQLPGWVREGIRCHLRMRPSSNWVRRHDTWQAGAARLPTLMAGPESPGLNLSRPVCRRCRQSRPPQHQPACQRSGKSVSLAGSEPRIVSRQRVAPCTIDLRSAAPAPFWRFFFSSFFWSAPPPPGMLQQGQGAGSCHRSALPEARCRHLPSPPGQAGSAACCSSVHPYESA